MPANEFEKQVQKRLDDFQLNPSASVWKNVEAQIRKKTRRRIILFFLLPLALGLLSYSIYYFVQTPEKTEQAKHVTAKDSDASTSDINQKTEIKEQPVQANPNEQIKSNELSIKKPGSETVSPVNKTVKGETQITSATPTADHRKNKPSTIQNDQIANAKKKEKTTKDNPSLVPVAREQTTNKVIVATDKPETGRVSKNQTEPPKVNNQPGAVVAVPKDPVTAKSDGIKTEDVAPDPKEPETAKANSANPEAVVNTDQKGAAPKKKSSGMKIKWGFDVSGGITSAETKAFTALKSYRADAAAAFNSGSPVAAASPFPGAATTLPPSSVESGAGFKVGVVGELAISKKSRVSMGLQYMYASNHIKTGTADRALRNQATNSFSSVDQVYRGPQTNRYENSYHFVSIPISYHWQINKSEKTGLRWNASISPSYLVSTDALIYSSSNGGSYYHDKSAFNKFHFSIGTGLSLRLKAKKGMEYIFGPEISFDTRKLMSNADQQQQYLIYGGIGARILFPSKKK